MCAGMSAPHAPRAPHTPPVGGRCGRTHSSKLARRQLPPDTAVRATATLAVDATNTALVLILTTGLTSAITSANGVIEQIVF